MSAERVRLYIELHRVAVMPGQERVYLTATGRGFYLTDDPATYAIAYVR